MFLTTERSHFSNSIKICFRLKSEIKSCCEKPPQEQFIHTAETICTSYRKPVHWAEPGKLLMCCVPPPPKHRTDDDLPTLLYDSTDLDSSKSESVNSYLVYKSDENIQLVLPQYDGNVSVSSSCMESSLNCSTLSKVNESCIPVVFGYRPTKVTLDRGLPYWKSIRRDNKAIQWLTTICAR